MGCPAVWTPAAATQVNEGEEDGKRQSRYRVGKDGEGEPPGGGCEMGSYPVYVVKAMKREDVKAGVEFANQYGLRLVVKNTGHDFLVCIPSLFPLFFGN